MGSVEVIEIQVCIRDRPLYCSIAYTVSMKFPSLYSEYVVYCSTMFTGGYHESKGEGLYL